MSKCWKCDGCRKILAEVYLKWKKSYTNGTVEKIHLCVICGSQVMDFVDDLKKKNEILVID